MTSGFSLYIHIPYCFHKCPYCDFNTYAVATIPEKNYVQALLSELDFRATLGEWHGRQVNTVYFGGGTPSLFAAGSIKRIISAIAQYFPLSTNVEISLEANPGTTTAESLEGYREAGVNRLSFGSQSFSIQTLKKLGRMHTPEQIVAAVEAARGQGYNNLNLDIIYGIEDQTLNELADDVRCALELAPEHISAYGLTIEKGTPFFRRYKKGEMKLPPEDTIIEMMKYLKETLAANELLHYEISNFAKKGREAEHNMAYWNGDDYLGLGAGAHSFFKSKADISAKRWSNYALPDKYISTSVATGNPQSWSDSLDKKGLIFEFFFLGLRKIQGVSKKDFHGRFGVNVEELYPVTIDMLQEQELLEVEGDIIRLSEQGLLVTDSVVESFIEIEDSGLDKLVGT